MIDKNKKILEVVVLLLMEMTTFSRIVSVLHENTKRDV